MCGIAGVINFKKKHADEVILHRMTCAMQHRGPDADSSFVEDEIALGHRRLSIIDLSDAANQPFADSTGRYRLIFNGELYNYLDVKAKLPSVKFRTSSDTEVLVEAFAAWGIKCLDYFKGMFAFAIWDRDARKLTIARDRLGVKPLYYYNTGDGLLFSSEVRALLATGLVPRKINHTAVYDYFRHQSVNSPISIIKGVLQLEAGHYMEIENDSISIREFWNIANFKGLIHDDKPKVEQKIYDLLTHSVEQRLISDVPIGAFLSGGIDSSAVVALMAQVSSSKPKTFVIGFDEKEFDESDYAEMVAKKFATDHHRILLRPQVMLDELTNALNSMDSPSGDGINTYVVSKEIKNAGITVALSGIGGDELFAGYPFFTQYEKLKKKQTAWNVLRSLRAAGSYFTGNDKLRDILNTRSVDINEVYPILRQVLSPSKLASFMNTSASEKGTVARKLDAKLSQIGKFPSFSQVSIAEYMSYTQQTLLKDTDQMSMAVSLEVREPFFDHELIEYVLSVPDDVKYPFFPKKLLVDSLKGLLPDEIVHRKKQGFVFPWQQWLKNELKEFAEVHFRRIAERDFMNKKEVLELWNGFLAGNKGIRWADVWLFIVLEYWLEKNDVS